MKGQDVAVNDVPEVPVLLLFAPNTAHITSFAGQQAANDDVKEESKATSNWERENWLKHENQSQSNLIKMKWFNCSLKIAFPVFTLLLLHKSEPGQQFSWFSTFFCCSRVFLSFHVRLLNNLKAAASKKKDLLQLQLLLHLSRLHFESL